jgi:cytochrome c peroxidase
VPFLHERSEIPSDSDYAERSATKKWRTTPLRALWQHPPYFHDGSAASLLDVVNRYNEDPGFLLGLTERQKADLVEFLKTL